MEIYFSTIFRMDLHESCMKEDIKSVKKIIKKQLKKTKKKFSRKSAKKSLKTLEDWINKKNEKNQTPLSIATSRGSIDIVKYLLKHGANPKIKGSIGTPIEIARSSMFDDVLEVLNSY